MISPKQAAANRRNAQHSTGPKSEAGQRRAAVNAVKHQLSIPVKDSLWGSRVPDIEQLLMSEGLQQSVANELALKIAEYERNVAYQRQRFLDTLQNKPPAQVVPDEALENLGLAAQLSRTPIYPPSAGKAGEKLTTELIREFERLGARQIRAASDKAERDLKSADRYLRRAANQMLKGLKAIKG